MAYGRSALGWCQVQFLPTIAQGRSGKFSNGMGIAMLMVERGRRGVEEAWCHLKSLFEMTAQPPLLICDWSKEIRRARAITHGLVKFSPEGLGRVGVRIAPQ